MFEGLPVPHYVAKACDNEPELRKKIAETLRTYGWLCAPPTESAGDYRICATTLID